MNLPSPNFCFVFQQALGNRLNPPLRNQKTIKTPTEIRGRSYWSNLDVTMRFLPAPVNSGIVFQRVDVPNQTRIPATVAHRVDLPRRSVLVNGTDTVDMVEHVMAALAGLQIDNCLIQIDRAEVPALDGSSRDFVRCLSAVGVVTQRAARPRLVVTGELHVGDDSAWVRAIPNHRSQFEIRYQLKYAHPTIGDQHLVYVHSPEAFVEELSGARTFLMSEEAAALRQLGVGLKVTNQEVLVFGANGPIDNCLRYQDECVRHKTLDVLGDLALAPYDIVGTIIAHRSGHRLNAEMAQELLSHAEIQYSSFRKSA